MTGSKFTRRDLLKSTALATASVVAAPLAAPYVHGAYAAGKLTIGFWDHWVPGANDTTQKLCEEWAGKEKVDIQIDFITSQGNKLLLTTAAEGQAKSGHDILAFPTWRPADHALQLEPVDDIMEPLIKQNGAVNATVEYLGNRRAGNGRQPDERAVLAHRPDEAARRRRCAGALSGRRPAQG